MSLREFDHTAVAVWNAANRYSLAGCALELLVRIVEFRQQTFESCARFVQQSLAAAQLKIFFDTNNVAVAMVVWAWVTPETQRRLVDSRRGVPELHPSEWREGRLLHVLAVVAAPGSMRTALSIFRERVAKADRVHWISRHGRLRSWG